jgi:hypothetical protein
MKKQYKALRLLCTAHLKKITYLVFFEDFCANALPATDFDFALVLPSRRILDALVATLEEVVLVFLAIIIHLLSGALYTNKKGKQA